MGRKEHLMFVRHGGVHCCSPSKHSQSASSSGGEALSSTRRFPTTMTTPVYNDLRCPRHALKLARYLPSQLKTVDTQTERGLSQTDSTQNTDLSAHTFIEVCSHLFQSYKYNTTAKQKYSFNTSDRSYPLRAPSPAKHESIHRVGSIKVTQPLTQS